MVASVVALMVPVTALLVPRFVLYRLLGLTDTLVPLVLPALLATSPFYVLVYYLAFRAVPGDLFDAARLADLSPLRTWWQVAMPLVKPVTAAVAALVFVLTWSNFIEPLVYVYDRDLFTVPLALRSLSTLDRSDYPVFLAGAVLASIPAFVLFAPRATLASSRPTVVPDGGADKEMVDERPHASRPPYPRPDRPVLAAVLALVLRGLRQLPGGGSRVGAALRRSRGAGGVPGADRRLRGGVVGRASELIEASDRDDLIARLSTSIAGGSPPDVFLLNYRYYGQFAASDSIAALDDRIADRRTGWPQTTSTPWRWTRSLAGEQLCLPQNVSSLAVYYNKDMFEQHGVAEPPDDWTWNDLIETAVALTRDAAGRRVVGTENEAGSAVDVYGLGVEASLIRLAPFVWSNGGELTDDPDQPTRFTLETPESTQALRDFLELRLAYGVIPTDAEVEALDDESRFANGKLAMLLSSRRVTTTFRSIDDFEWDVAPLPVHDEQVGILHSDAFCITAASERQDEAWDFIEYALSAEGQEVLVKTGRTVPSNIELSRSSAFLDQGPATEPLAGVPRRGRTGAGDAGDLDVAGDRGRGRSDPRGRPLQGALGQRGGVTHRRGDPGPVRPRGDSVHPGAAYRRAAAGGRASRVRGPHGPARHRPRGRRR